MRTTPVVPIGAPRHRETEGASRSPDPEGFMTGRAVFIVSWAIVAIALRNLSAA